MNAVEDPSVTTEGPLLLNRSYDTARAGRRIRSAAAAARSSARGSRVRPAVSTSSVPATTTVSAQDGDQMVVAQDVGGSQANDAGVSSDLLGRRRRRRRRTENETETEKETSLAADQLQLTLDDDQPVNGSFATAADSNLLDVGSPRVAETVKTKKRMKKKSRGSSEALSSDAHDASTAGQEFEPDLSISKKDFSPSFEMRTSSPVEMFSFKAEPVPDATEIKALETECDPDLWTMFDTPLNDLCKRLLADQNFDKLNANDEEKLDTEVRKLKHLPAVDDLHETGTMEVDVEHQVQPEATTELPLKVKKQENQMDITVLPLQTSSTALPTTNEGPIRRKTARHKKQVEDVLTAQPTEQHKKDSRVGEDSTQSSMDQDVVENGNVLNVLSSRETEADKSKLTKNQEDAEDIPAAQSAETYEKDSRLSRLGKDPSQFSMETDTVENRNVPNVLSLRETEADKSKHIKNQEDTETAQSAETYEKDSRLGEDPSKSSMEPDTVENGNVPNVLSLREREEDKSKDKSKLNKHKKHAEDIQLPASQSTEKREDRRHDEDSSQFSMERDTTENKNVPNVLALRETRAGKSKLDKKRKRAKDVPAEQYDGDSGEDSRFLENYSSQSSTEPHTASNKNVPNILSLRETERNNSQLAKHEKQIEDVSADQLTETRNSVVGEDTLPTEKDSSQLSTELDTTGNRNVPNISSWREYKLAAGPSSPGFSKSALRETSELGQAEVRGMPDIIPSSQTPETVTQAVDEEMQSPDDDDDDVAAVEEMERLEREQRQLMEEEKRRQEQEQRERLEKEEQERRDQEIEEQRDQEKTERRERKRQEKEEKERRRRERKERKELEKRQSETLADELPVNVDDTNDHIPTVPMQDSGYIKETVDIKIEEPRDILQSSDNSRQVSSNVNDAIDVKAASYDPYANIPMVDDVVDDEENIPPAEYSHEELTPNFEKSAKKKPPSGRKMPPRSPLFPAPVPAKPEDGSTAEQKDSLTYFRATTPRTTLKEAKARDRESSARQRSRSADRSSTHDRGQSHRAGPYLTLVDIDIESTPADSAPASLSRSFDGGQPFSASSPIPPDFLIRRSLRPARSEEMLFVKKLSSRSPTPSCELNDELNDSTLGSVDGGQWIRAAKSVDFLNRSTAGSEFSGDGLGRRSVSREWQVVTTTTKEEIVFVKRLGEDTEERRRIEAEYEKNKQVRERNEQRLTKEREKIERERLDRLLAELRRRRQKERQQLLDKKLAEKKAKEENDRFIREAVEHQRQIRLAEDKARREEEQRKRDELNEKWQQEREERERLAKEKQERMEREHREKQLEMDQLRSQIEENERQEREEQARRKKELQEKREKEEKERRDREQEQERQRKEKQAHEGKLKLEQIEREAKLRHEKMEKERLEKEARRREEEIERLEKEREMMEKLAEEHKLKLEQLEEEKRLHQEQLEEEKSDREETKRIWDEKRQTERQEIEKRVKEEIRRSELERREREALEKIIQEQKLRLEELERQEKLREQKMERESIEKEEERRVERMDQEDTENATGYVDVSATEKEIDSVFADQPSTSLLLPSSPLRPRVPSREIATQTEDDSSEVPEAVVGQVLHYPAEVVTERLFSDSESPTSSPVPNIDDPTASSVQRPADPPVRRRPKSTASADDDNDGDVTPVVVHEYGELLSFWRGDPTDGRLTRARANSRRAAGADGEGEATVRDFNLPPEQWASDRVDTVEQSHKDDEDKKYKSEARPTPNIDDTPEATRHQEGDDDGRSASATDDRSISEKTLIHSTLGCIG